MLRQRQLVQSVREVMAFLAYQQQRSLLFNCKVQIVLWLSPINKLEAKSLTTPTTKESIQLGLNNQLIRSTATRFTFCGLRQTLRPMHFVLSNGDEEVKIIISSLGRIRACSQTIKAFSVC
ncbi:putative prepilin peptidase dependent protein A [Proteus mirabilis]|nr:putative prepilin peptidase dependent protein A [Proteus mirabilis]